MNNLKRIFLPVLFLFTILSLCAQDKIKNELLQNPNIVWLAEAHYICYLDHPPENAKITPKVSSKIVKLSSKKEENGLYDTNNDLPDRFFEAFNKAEVSVYLDDDLKQKTILHPVKSYNRKKFKLYGTERSTINEIYLSEIRAFQVKLFISYDTSDHLFHFHPIAIAPLRIVWNKPDSLSSFFWMPVSSEQIDVSNSEIDYVKQVQSTLYFNTSEFNILKEDRKKLFVFHDFMDHIVNYGPFLRLYEKFETNSKEITEDQKQDIYNFKAYIPSFDVEKMEAFEYFVEWNLQAGNFNGFQLGQQWSWNAETKTLNILTVGFAPLFKEYRAADDYDYISFFWIFN